MTDNPLGLGKDHIFGSFKWEYAPECSCGRLKDAIEAEKFIFVSNFTSDDWNHCYMMPLASDGELVREDGIAITHCPWCGDKITIKKRYEKNN